MADFTAIFDVDGTLVDSRAMFTSVMAAAFEAEGLAAPDPDMALRLVGISLPQLVAMLAPDIGADRQDAVVATYRRLYNAAVSDGAESVPYPGVDAGLRRLHATGMRLAIATGKSRRGLDRLVAREGWGDLFSSLQCADVHPSKPHPSMVEKAIGDLDGVAARTAMVGDTTFDMEMARSAGVAALGVGWGYHGAAELTAAGAFEVFPDFGAAVIGLEARAG